MKLVYKNYIQEINRIRHELEEQLTKEMLYSKPVERKLTIKEK